jgi:hypothetical protein
MATFQKVALITAGSAGLGAQIARVLAPDFRLVCEVNILKDLISLNNSPLSPFPPGD